VTDPEGARGEDPWVLLWDIDGTLLSTGRAGILALEDAAREILGTTVDFSALKTAGLTDFQVAALAIETAGVEPTPETVEAFVRVYERELPDRLHARRGTVLPGVEAILAHLSGREDVVSLLLTGNTEAGAAAKLRHYGLSDFFSGGGFSLDGAERAAVARRARDLAAERIGAPPAPERTWVIGDTPHDVECGQAIDARTLAVATGTYSTAELEEHGPSLAVEELPAPEAFLTMLGLPATSAGRGPSS